VVAVLLAVSGCAARWGTFPHRYGSNVHIPPAQRLIQVSASPRQVAAYLKKEIRQGGGKILSEQGGIAKWYGVSEASDRDWRESRLVAEQEWVAIRSRNREAFDRIDRSRDKLTGAHHGDMEVVHGEASDGILLEAEVWSRPARSANDVVEGSTVGTYSTTRTHANVKTFSTRISFYIWRVPSGSRRSNVYVFALPVVDAVTAGSGGELPLEWLPFATGEQEATVVRSYLKLLTAADAHDARKRASR